MSENTPAVNEEEAAPTESPRESLLRRLAARRLLRAEVFYAFGLAGFGVLAVLAYYHAYFGWDLRAARAVQSIALPGWPELMYLTSLAGDGLVPHALTAATMLLFFARRRFSEGAGVLLSAGAGGMLSKGLKILINRPRPAAELVGFSYSSDEMSFPSGHVTFYVCYFGFLFFVAFALLPRDSFRRRAALVLLALPVLLVGLSRVYLRAHWPSDTLGAYLLAGVWLGLSLEMYRRWKKRATIRRAVMSESEEAVSNQQSVKTKS